MRSGLLARYHLHEPGGVDDIFIQLVLSIGYGYERLA